MKYREVMEVIIRGRERERVTLVPVPGLPGHWMPCHQAIVTACPGCGSEPYEPCQPSKGGAYGLTIGMVNTVRKLARGERVAQFHLQALRKRIDTIKTYQREIHSARKRAWVKAGMRNPRSKHKNDWG